MTERLISLQLGPETNKGVDRVVLHLLIDLVRAEPGALEQPRQAARGMATAFDDAEDAVEVLEGRFMLLPRETARGTPALVRPKEIRRGGQHENHQ